MSVIKILPIVLLFLTLPLLAQTDPLYEPKARFHPVVGKHGMVSSQESYATRAGLQVLREGGNAVDAAVTVGFTLAVTLPRAGNLGGGGFMLVYLAEKDEVVAIDYREKAPLGASRNMYLQKNGEVDREKSMHSILSAGVPGTVAGLTLALEKYGTIPLKRVIRPALELASRGFPVNEELRRTLIQVKERMERSEAAMSVFFKEGGEPYSVGEILTQKDLARSLDEISENGVQAFYSGAIAERIEKFMQENGGLITKEDLTSYKPVIRKPVKGTYRDYEIYSMPPPSSGGVHLIQILNLLEGFELSKMGHNTAQAIHTMTEAKKLAYADRSKHMGDPDFSPVNTAELISKKYAKQQQLKINTEKATPSTAILPGELPAKEGSNTTHFSVMDKNGNAVSNTYTLNFRFGSKIMVPGTGILLNNEMDDFSSKPGVPNAYGLTGGELNSIEPGKRMLSSMTPTIVMKEGKPFLITGSPGGSRIITTVLQIILNVLDFSMNIAEATNALRVHHQWLPDVLYVEEGLNDDTVRLLKDMGHNVEYGNTMGCTESIMKVGDYLYGASDPRKRGGLTIGY
jgi:gamma-glutamyltranspeptidase / glutathione hydrolase